MPAKEYKTPEEAKRDLGNQGYFALHRWLVSKGYRNLNEKYITSDQMAEFIREQVKEFKGITDVNQLWGQTVEIVKKDHGQSK